MINLVYPVIFDDKFAFRTEVGVMEIKYNYYKQWTNYKSLTYFLYKTKNLKFRLKQIEYKIFYLFFSFDDNKNLKIFMFYWQNFRVLFNDQFFFADILKYIMKWV